VSPEALFLLLALGAGALGLVAWLRSRAKKRAEQPYAGVRIVNAATGEVIEGQEAVENYFAEERALLEEHGSTITFQLFRIDLSATTLEAFQGECLVDHQVGGDFVAGTDSVRQVKGRLKAALLKHGLRGSEQLIFFFGGRPMRDDALFFADHFMMLPSWVQVLAHECEVREVLEKLVALSGAGPATG